MDDVTGIHAPSGFIKVELSTYTFSRLATLNAYILRRGQHTTSAYSSALHFRFSNNFQVNSATFNLRSFSFHSKSDDTPSSGTTSHSLHHTHIIITITTTKKNQLGVIFTSSSSSAGKGHRSILLFPFFFLNITLTTGLHFLLLQ